MKHERAHARTISLLVLYEVDCVGHSPEAVLSRYLEEDRKLSENGIAFAHRLVMGTLENAAALDRLVAGCAPEWPVDELAIVDRNILRMALWEFALGGETPIKVAINEAVELAKRFGSDSAPRFVNGVLGTLAQREDEVRRELQAVRSR